MKQISILLMSLFGATALVACGGGSSGGNGGGGDNPPSACANGQPSCGALESATPFSQVIPINSLPLSGLTVGIGESPVITSVTNLYLSNQQNSYISFSVESNGITQPFIIDFSILADDANIPSGSSLPQFTNSTSVGQAGNQCKFPSDSTGSYNCTLTISPNSAPSGKYKITGTILNGNQPFEINVVTNFEESTTLILPYGTYIDNSSLVFGTYTDQNHCANPHYIDHQTLYPGQTYVITHDGEYMCIPNFGQDNNGFCAPELVTNNSLTHVVILPSEGSRTNGMWQNSSWSFNTPPEPSCLGSGLIDTWRYTYIGSSESLPYPLATTNKTKFNGLY